MLAGQKREERIRRERHTANEWRKVRKLELYPDLYNKSFVDYLKPMIIVSLNTGLRRKELFLSTWKNIKWDQENQVLTVPGTIAKNKKTRHVYLNETALNALLLWKKQSNGVDDYIFPSQNGKPKNNVKTAWTNLLKKAKIVDFRWHDMRHDFASRLAMSGVDLNHIRELLGHRDPKTTLRYAHLAPSNLNDAVKKLDIKFSFEIRNESNYDETKTAS